MRQIIQLSKINNGVLQSLRVKMAHGEFNRPLVKLEPVFYDGFFEIKTRPAILAPLLNRNRSNQKARKIFGIQKVFFESFLQACTPKLFTLFLKKKLEQNGFST